ncbi:MAG: 3-methyl-2-oxobutanoate hydroxymethyltransferase [Actinobacteria bacterium]|nr:3-methyl-2-oxobutanoate hydroxymethyltransferase [Actinomycetota bacterium]
MTTTPRKAVTVPLLAELKLHGQKITMITAYDATFAAIVDASGVDVILVGDSVATTVQGEANTIPVTMEEMEYHVRLVRRAAPKALVVGDLPFGSYQVGSSQAVANSVRLIKAGAQAVKLEGGLTIADSIRAIADADIPIMGHIGLTPQSVHRMGGHKVQGRRDGFEAGGRQRLLEDAHAVEQAGAFAVVLEGIPALLAAEITTKLSIPTIGIGAGAQCDGQVLVLHDVLGLSLRELTFTKKFADIRGASTDACRQFVDEVRAGLWPDDAHSFE